MKKRRPENVLARLLRHCDGDVSNPNDHWLWTGFCKKEGYGTFGYKHKCTTAHRAMFHATYPHIKIKGYDVAHKRGYGCPRNCVNPNHLYKATRKENISDSIFENTHKSPLGYYISPELKAKIISECIVEKSNARALAKEFGTSRTHVCEIVRGISRKSEDTGGNNVHLTWKQVEEIRRRYKPPSTNLLEIAKKYGVVKSTLCKWRKNAAC